MTNHTQKIEDCRRIYLEQNGRNHARIERRMRALGHRFNRRVLYARTVNDTRREGWPKLHGWTTELPGNAGALACMSDSEHDGNHSQPQPAETSRQAAKSQSRNAGRNPTCREGVSAEMANEECRMMSSGSETWNPEPGTSQTPTGNLPSFETFESFLRSAGGGMEWDRRHHQRLCYYLRRITEGKCKRLMIFMPPRHGKSETVTTRYAAWRLWQNPKMRVVVGSYNQHLANRFSRSIRRVLSEEEDKHTAPAQLQDSYQGAAKPHTRNARRDMSQTRNLESGMPASGRRIFPRSRTVNTMSEWETAHGGGVKAVGVGAGITGFGADLLIIDDPVKSTSQAHSKVFREKTWRWFRDDISTRLEPGAPMILIQTRWHDDDLAGRLLKKMQEGGEHWDVLKMPALVKKDKGESPSYCESPRVSKGGIRTNKEEISRKDAKTQSRSAGGNPTCREGVSAETMNEECRIMNNENEISNLRSEISEPETWNPEPEISPAWNLEPGISHDDLLALWPERFPVEELLKIKESIGSYMFNALYQQSPSPEEGGIFKRPWFTKIVDAVPPGLQWCRGYDLAVSTRTTADFTASFRVAKDEAGNFYIADGYRGRLEFPDQRRYVLERMRSEPSTVHGIEAALHGQALVQDLGREPGIANIPLKSVDVDKDKMTRALAWAAPAEAGKVFLVRGAWIDAFVEELAAFPAGTHDDQIDAVSLAFRLIAEVEAELEKEKSKPKYRSGGF